MRQLGLDTTDAVMVDESGDEEIVEGIPVNPALDAWVVRSWRYGIPSWTFQALLICGAPPILFNLLFWINEHNRALPNGRDLDVVEMFAGLETICRSGIRRGWHSAKYDISIDAAFNDFMTGIGFLTALLLNLRLGPGSISTWATQCSSWIWLARAITMRSNSRPMGPADFPHRAATPPLGSTWINSIRRAATPPLKAPNSC